MIASLRGRLVAGVLVAGRGAGMLLVGGVTYATQRSFLLDRVDAQLASAIARARSTSSTAPTSRSTAARGGGGPPPGGGAPTDTYGELRDASGNVLDERVPRPGRHAARSPTCRRTSPLGEPETVDTPQGDYRVLAQAARRRRRRSSPRSRCAATNQALERLLLVEGIVIVGVLGARRRLRARSSSASACCRWTAWATPPPRSPAATSRTASRRPTRAPRSAGSGIALNRMLDRLEDAFAAREASQERLRRFIADASHELRTPLVSIRGYAELYRMGAARSSRGRREGDAPDRGRGGAHGRARRGPADAGAAGRGARGAARRRSTSPCSPATPSTTRA